MTEIAMLEVTVSGSSLPLPPPPHPSSPEYIRSRLALCAHRLGLHGVHGFPVHASAPRLTVLYTRARCLGWRFLIR